MSIKYSNTIFNLFFTYFIYNCTKKQSKYYVNFVNKFNEQKTYLNTKIYIKLSNYIYL